VRPRFAGMRALYAAADEVGTAAEKTDYLMKVNNIL
jgi:hypothetical protein